MFWQKLLEILHCLPIELLTVKISKVYTLSITQGLKFFCILKKKKNTNGKSLAHHSFWHMRPKFVELHICLFYSLKIESCFLFCILVFSGPNI